MTNNQHYYYLCLLSDYLKAILQYYLYNIEKIEKKKSEISISEKNRCYNMGVIEREELGFMAITTKKDIEMLKELESYLFDINKDSMFINGDSFMIKKEDVKDEKALALYLALYEFVERMIETKKERSRKQNVFNKNNREYHKITNKIWYYRKKKNLEKLKYWQDRLEELKKEIK